MDSATEPFAQVEVKAGDAAAASKTRPSELPSRPSETSRSRWGRHGVLRVT